jgi:hypothetical protein
MVEASYPEGTHMTIVGVIADIRTTDISYGPVNPTAYQPDSSRAGPRSTHEATDTSP